MSDDNSLLAAKVLMNITSKRIHSTLGAVETKLAILTTN
jgi:hypothetical protein